MRRQPAHLVTTGNLTTLYQHLSAVSVRIWPPTSSPIGSTAARAGDGKHRRRPGGSDRPNGQTGQPGNREPGATGTRRRPTGQLQFRPAQPHQQAQRIASLYDTDQQQCVDSRARRRRRRRSTRVTHRAGQIRQLLPCSSDAVTTSQASDLPARINVNTAPQRRAPGLPGLAARTWRRFSISARPWRRSVRRSDLPDAGVAVTSQGSRRNGPRRWSAFNTARSQV